MQAHIIVSSDQLPAAGGQASIVQPAYAAAAPLPVRRGWWLLFHSQSQQEDFWEMSTSPLAIALRQQNYDVAAVLLAFGAQRHHPPTTHPPTRPSPLALVLLQLCLRASVVVKGDFILLSHPFLPSAC